jgi:predicted ArsR family transcriptional regulator
MNGHHHDPDPDLDALATLAGKLRRDLYDFVTSSPSPVSRDEAAMAVGVARQAAAYHLDHLVDQGLLEVEFKRLTGRVGPGAGRPSKLYRASERSFEVSVPPRRYELASRILLQAVASNPAERRAMTEAAHHAGEQIGLNGLDEGLRATGYRPVSEGGVTRFRNCPFDALRKQDRDTACEMNLALVQGMIEGSGARFDAELAPEDGYCCVRLRPRGHESKEDTG